MRFLTQSPTGWLRRAVAAVATLAAVAAVGAVAQQRHRAWQRPGGWDFHQSWGRRATEKPDFSGRWCRQ